MFVAYFVSDISCTENYFLMYDANVCDSDFPFGMGFFREQPT